MKKEQALTKVEAPVAPVTRDEILALTKDVHQVVSDIDTSDMVIPRMLLAQPLLDLVVDGKFQSGDILLGGNNPRSLAKRGEFVEIIPVQTYKSFTIWRMNERDPVYVRSEMLTHENINAPREWEEDGVLMKRDRLLNFYVLPVDGVMKELEAFKKFAEEGEIPDPDAALLPWLVTFKKTSYTTGRDLITWFKKCEHFGVPAFVNTWKLSATLEKGEKGSYNVYKLEKGRRTTAEEIRAAVKWSSTLRSAKAIKVEEDIEDLSAKPTVQHDEEAF